MFCERVQNIERKFAHENLNCYFVESRLLVLLCYVCYCYNAMFIVVMAYCLQAVMV